MSEFAYICKNIIAQTEIFVNAFSRVRAQKPYIQSHIETLLAKEIICGDIEPDSVLKVDLEGPKLFISNA